MYKERQEYADGLRKFAEWVEETDVDYLPSLRVDLFSYDKQDFDEKASQVGGYREKALVGSYAIVRRNFGPHSVEVNIPREKVCERVQVGEKTVPAAEAAPERVEPVYEWQCEGFTVTA